MLTKVWPTLDTKEWAQLECTGEAPSQRSGHNAVMYQGNMYVFGGYDGSKRLNDLFKLDISAFSHHKKVLHDWTDPKHSLQASESGNT